MRLLAPIQGFADGRYATPGNMLIEELTELYVQQ